MEIKVLVRGWWKFCQNGERVLRVLSDSEKMGKIFWRLRDDGSFIVIVSAYGKTHGNISDDENMGEF